MINRRIAHEEFTPTPETWHINIEAQPDEANVGTMTVKASVNIAPEHIDGAAHALAMLLLHNGDLYDLLEKAFTMTQTAIKEYFAEYPSEGEETH